MREPNFAYNPITDALMCASRQNAFNEPTIKYGRGVIVGLVAGIMSNYMNTFEETLRMIVDVGLMDNDVRLHPNCIPPGEEWDALRDLERNET